MPRRPRNAEDDASFKGMGLAIGHVREQRGLDRAELAKRIEEDQSTLGKIEKGEVVADWATLRVIAYALGLPLGALLNLAVEHAPGPGGDEWRKRTSEIEQAQQEHESGRTPMTKIGRVIPLAVAKNG